MQHYLSLDDVQVEHAWLTIGTFDGVHKGHQEILRNLVTGAHQSSAPAVVLTFHPHPRVVLGNKNERFYLTTTEERANLLGDLGVDIVITHPFNTTVANTSAWDFVVALKKHLGLSHLWVGSDFALGKNRQGDVSTLRNFGHELDYTLHVVEPIIFQGEIISSSKIRQALAEGNVEYAASLLGRPYRLSGEVIHGDGRGRPLGIPTANLDIAIDRAMPKSGVYVCKAYLDDKSWGAVTNIGFRPTFEDQPLAPRVETHLLDNEPDLYGHNLHLDFLHRLRDEERFPNVQALVNQIQVDIKRSREYLQKI